MSLCALNMSRFRVAFGIREVASANSASIDVWGMGNLYRVVILGGRGVAYFIPTERNNTQGVLEYPP